MTDHLYGDEPECALCGHYGPDGDERPCLSQLEAGKFVHALTERATKAEADAARLAEALRVMLTLADDATMATAYRDSPALYEAMRTLRAALAAHDAGEKKGGT